MYSINTLLLVKMILIGFLAGQYNAGVVKSNERSLPNSNENSIEHTDSVKLSNLIDFFNMYDSLVSAEERDENLSEQEIDDREIELLMLTLPRMGRVLKEDGTEFNSQELKEIVNNNAKLFKRAIPRFGKRAIPRFGKRAIPRFG